MGLFGVFFMTEITESEIFLMYLSSPEHLFPYKAFWFFSAAFAMRWRVRCCLLAGTAGGFRLWDEDGFETLTLWNFFSLLSNTDADIE